jgi:glycosyltransferase involved in cell wall biosynthesis
MRFVFLTLGYHPDTVGGGWRYAAEVAERLAQRGHSVSVVCQNTEAALPDTEIRRGVRLVRFPRGSGGFFRKWRHENRLAQGILGRLSAEAPEPALLGLHHAYLQPALASAMGRKLFMFHGPWAEEYRFARQANRRTLLHRCLDEAIAMRLRATERRALRSVDQVFVTSQHFRGNLSQWHPVPLPNVQAIGGGTDTEQFKPASDRLAARRAYGLEPDHRLFLAVRRLDPRMGLLVLIEAFSRVAASFPRSLLWLAGRGPLQEELGRRILGLGLGDRVRLLGFVPEADLPRLLSAADCTVVPSLDLEGFGLATVESLACGTPVLGSRAGATPELLTPFSPQLLFDSGSASSLADQLRAILTDPGRLPGRQSCRDYALRHFTWEGPVSAFEACHRRWVSAGSKP